MISAKSRGGARGEAYMAFGKTRKSPANVPEWPPDTPLSQTQVVRFVETLTCLSADTRPRASPPLVLQSVSAASVLLGSS